MAATFVISRSRVFGNARCLLNQSSNHHSSFTSIRKKQSNVAFLLGFGLAGFVGFSGILYGKKQKKRITATSIEKDSLAVEENCSSQSVSVSSYYHVRGFHLIIIVWFAQALKSPENASALKI